MRLLEAEGHFGRRIAFEEGEVGRILSEEITPEDWARLVTGIDEHLRGGTASGIVVTHGTDTLAYTASLVFWLFPRPPVPIVLAASLRHAGQGRQRRHPDAAQGHPGRGGGAARSLRRVRRQGPFSREPEVRAHDPGRVSQLEHEEALPHAGVPVRRLLLRRGPGEAAARASRRPSTPPSSCACTRACAAITSSSSWTGA